MAPPAEPPTSITLRVKVPPGHVPGGADEFTLGTDIPVTSKIGQIRERIQEAIPSSPTPERQRILYGGRALVDNDQTVADALNVRRDPSQTEYVIHLLVKGEGANAAPVPHRTGLRTPGQSASPAPGAQPVNAPAATPVTQPVQEGAPAQNQLPRPPFAHEALLAQQQQLLHHQMQQFRHYLPHQQGMMPNQWPPLMPQMPLAPGMAPGFQNMAGPAPQNIAPATGQQNQNETVQNGTEQSQQAPTQGEGGQASAHHTGPHDPARPSSQLHYRIQQTHHVRFPGQPMPFGQHMIPPQMQGLAMPPPPPTPQANASGRSNLERARENIAEMQRTLDQLRDSNAASEAQQAQIRSLQERAQHLSDYIDPFPMLNAASNRARSQSPRTTALQNGGTTQVPPAQTPSPALGWQQRARQIRQAQQPHTNTDSSNVTCWLLSSPTGPRAILYSPQHGAYTGQMPGNGSLAASAGLHPTPTTSQAAGTGPAANPAAQQNRALAQGQVDAAQQVQAQAQAQAAPDPLGPLGPVMGHLWLLLRILIFSYFLLGANMGWRRPMALLAIGFGFWMIRMGLLGDGGALRRWWDGIMNEGRAPQAQQGEPAQQQNQGQNQQEGEQQGQQPAANGGLGQMPTPEQVAQRLLDEDARARNEARDQRLQWVRERIRPVERAVALLVASLWPGVGEAYVRAREQEDRRRAEEEIAARRREEEERQKKEDEEKQKSEGGKDNAEKNEGLPEAAPNATSADAATTEETAAETST